MGHKLIPLTGILAEIEEVAGREVALSIATAHGGLNKKFPTATMLEKAPQNYSNNWLVLTVGYETALKIVKELFPGPGLAVELPKASLAIQQKVILEHGYNLSLSQLALLLNVTEKSARRIRNKFLRDAK